MNAEPGTLAEPNVNQRQIRLLEGDRNRPIIVSSTAQEAAIEGDRGSIDMLLTELYNREPGLVSPTERFSVQARPKQALHVTSNNNSN